MEILPRNQYLSEKNQRLTSPRMPPHWLAVAACLLPLLLYAWAFFRVAYNVNYIAYDDITILSVIPGFDEASWPERWRRLTDLFPEHRLVFSRSLVLLFYELSGRVNLVWLMIIANVAWAGCAWLFYRVFRRLHLSLWYFVPVMWIWFNIQSFENIYWGVSSLANFGVLFFALLALYLATHYPQRLLASLLAAIAATFTYGNGLMIFPVLAGLAWITGRKKDFFIIAAVAVATSIIYFIDFTPITESMSLTNPTQVQQAIASLFGFIGSIATLWGYAAYNGQTHMLYLAVPVGVVMVALLLWVYRAHLPSIIRSVWSKPVQLSPAAQFALVTALFVAITTFAVVYKRIPIDEFHGMFKGRYRMYSAMWLVALYLGAITLHTLRFRMLGLLIAGSMVLNLALLYTNFAAAVENRRQAIALEFNSRYNADWLGLKMFDIDQAYFEKIRSYYGSDDPLAEGWNPRQVSAPLPCVGSYPIDSVYAQGGGINVYSTQDFFEAEKDYTDGPYVLLKSDTHIYASPPGLNALPARTFFRRLRYFGRGFNASFFQASIEPGTYQIYLLVRQNGINKIYCTDRTWVEKD
ncbi:hypothetical protein [Telluribacter sp. SYSU D00476]|uniref:hypothetical protein n=1 Tax=Telluribacter sp. SYSU D00476 TaxID=2811430 RepID=UPI001FF3E0F2|nr:hypothetical protein [Telluribacter sp. SYSU D00476]